ncbi:MAG: UDP-N-acetylmuramate--L-alanine ligase, partial [Candidatus Dormibacteraeota bacterium]|nr:UDP-N-acetylmuramate--L-alanine ligase [Candidatus Dormibacteraeota bacterium]
AALGADASCRVITYGVAADAQWRIAPGSDDGTVQRFTVQRQDLPQLDVRLTFPGLHNAQNACAALALAGCAGVADDIAVAACATFRGPARRFEILDATAPVVVVDDYAHHPTEVAAAIDAARHRYGGRRLVAIHTPHTYSRTRTMLEEYSHVFRNADVVVLGPIEAARERGQEPGVSIADVAVRAATHNTVHVVASSDEAIELLCGLAEPGDVMLVLSLGGFDKLAPRLRDGLAMSRAGV